ncbi:hypothetical protein [Prevotellamassilia timonensis]|uniref:hypothetical protein n=1 Tax=Prevotellamassilia timonensis TaxID=1852370 RepID=UPI00402527D0
MTEDKSKRKSTRKFNLEKHVKRSFNLEKEVAATPAPSAETPATPQPAPTPAPAGGGDATQTGNGGNKGKHVLSLVVGLAVVAAIGFAAFRGCNSNSSQPVDEPVVDTVMDEQPTAPTDSTQRADSTQFGGGDQNAPAGAPNEVQPQDDAVNAATPSAQSETSTPSTPSPTKATAPSTDMDAEVQKVLHGDYGNGQERKDKLGSSYSKIQRAVNRYYRSKGLL